MLAHLFDPRCCFYASLETGSTVGLDFEDAVKGPVVRIAVAGDGG